MEKEFVPYQPSLDMKKLGFDEPCFGYHLNNEFQFFADVRSCNTNSEFKFYPTAPTFSQAFRWFRDKHELHRHTCYFEDSQVWHGDTYKLPNNGLMNNPMELTNYISYEEAELACLIKLIEIVKQK